MTQYQINIDIHVGGNRFEARGDKPQASEEAARAAADELESFLTGRVDPRHNPLGRAAKTAAFKTRGYDAEICLGEHMLKRSVFVIWVQPIEVE